jgi:hypothetical protein
VQQGCGAGVRRDRGRDPLEMVDHGIAKAVALTFMVLSGDSVCDLGFHGPSFASVSAALRFAGVDEAFDRAHDVVGVECDRGDLAG